MEHPHWEQDPGVSKLGWCLELLQLNCAGAQAAVASPLITLQGFSSPLTPDCVLQPK